MNESELKAQNADLPAVPDDSLYRTNTANDSELWPNYVTKY